MYNGILLYCRPGFEKECLAEITDLGSERSVFGWANLEMNSGFVLFETEQAEQAYELLPRLVFSRDAWPILARLDDLNPKDRLAPIIHVVKQFKQQQEALRIGGVSTEFAEGDDYRATAKFSGKFVHPVRQGLRNEQLIASKDEARQPYLRLFFKDSSQVLIGLDRPGIRSPWPMGIARLKFPAAAPSRSTLKLEEGFQYFLGNSWRVKLERANTGVDLGAAPGGWTWQLVNQGIHVYAVDNGPMDKQLMDSGLVDHVQEDGFVWKPAKKVDWLVCDMVEKPARVARLIYDWLDQRHASYAMFNLKLPMKKRYQQWQEIKDYLEALITQQHPKAIFRAKHLYHDREEITVYLDLGNQNG
ncbi:MAG: 23S rRNA (cytidine(2498)-2'-O)-methyltransferase RlmM [Reinekea sp.]|jgi:23S rRNA (cytidine2498-2'-O)-methyltransferase